MKYRGAGVAYTNIRLSRDNGLTWETIADNWPDSEFTWRVTYPTTSFALMRVVDSYVPTRMDLSDQVFAIVSGCCANRTGNIDCDVLDGCDISDLSALIDYLYITFTPPAACQ